MLSMTDIKIKQPAFEHLATLSDGDEAELVRREALQK
jgi:hypothetical protein